MNSLLRYSTAYSEPWVAWLMLALLIVLLLADFYQRGLISGSLLSLFATKERQSLFSETVRTGVGSIFLFVYRIAVISLAVYTLLWSGGSFSFLSFLFVCLLVFALTLFKYASVWLTAFVFFDKRTLQVIYLHYDNLSTVFCIFLYPLLLLALFAPFFTHTLIVVTFSVLAFFALCIWLWKAFKLFFNNFLACLYIFLYLCTLELIPLLALIEAVRLWVL